MKIRSIIVDDNPLNVEILSDLLRDGNHNIEIVGKAENGKEALELIQREQPDLVFLDVEMPDMNGFEMLASLKEINFQTIFVTAFSHYAIPAIRFNALDYLVKPIDPKELNLAIRRYRSDGKAIHKHQIQNALDNMNIKNALDQVLYLPTQEGGIKMVLRDIIKIEGDRNYSTFHLSTNKTKVSSKTLGYFEEILNNKVFFRCHRSYLVNHHHIKELQKDSFLMKNGTKLPISRRRKTAASEWFSSRRSST
jgi:two-component system LytT family response regulator